MWNIKKIYSSWHFFKIRITEDEEEWDFPQMVPRCQCYHFIPRNRFWDIMSSVLSDLILLNLFCTSAMETRELWFRKVVSKICSINFCFWNISLCSLCIKNLQLSVLISRTITYKYLEFWFRVWFNFTTVMSKLQQATTFVEDWLCYNTTLGEGAYGE